MFIAYIKKFVFNMICVIFVSKRDNMFFVSQVSGLVENFNIGIQPDTINVIKVKLCMMIQFIEFHLFIPLSVMLTIVQGHSRVKHF